MNGLIKFFARLFVLRIVLKRMRQDKTSGYTQPMTTRSSATKRGAARRSPAPARADSEDGGGRIPSQTKGGPGPESPLELEGSDWKATARRTLSEIKEDRVTLAAAGMAYYFFLALFPALIALIGIMDLVNMDSGPLIESIKDTLPKGAGSFVTDALADAERPSQDASLIAAITGIALALWAASSGMVAMQSGLNIAYDVPADRKFIGKRGVALLLIIVTGLLGTFPSPLFTWGDDTVFTVIGIILSAIAVVLLFSIFYYVAPNRESPRWTWVSAGGIVGAVLWIGASIGFGYYVDNFGKYGETYGAAAGIVVLIFWLFITSISVLVGGELNSEIERQAEKRKQREKA